MVFSLYKQQRILYYYLQGYKAPTIATLLTRKKLLASRQGIQKFLKHYKKTGSTGRSAGLGRCTKIIQEIRLMVEAQVSVDDETMACQLHCTCFTY